MIRTIFSSPRLEATFQDWPLGGNRRGFCAFKIEHNPKRGYRFSRQTEANKPKLTTFSGQGAIVDGSDGKTYLLQRSQSGFIHIRSSDLLTYATVWPADQDGMYTLLNDLIEEANRP